MCWLLINVLVGLLYAQDITARIAQEEEYSRLIDTANAPIFGVDMSGMVTVWNKCAANISGYSSEDTMGHCLVQEFITEDFRASVQAVFDKALKGLEDSNFAFPLVTKDGRRLEILLNATSRRDVDGHIIGVVGNPGCCAVSLLVALHLTWCSLVVVVFFAHRHWAGAYKFSFIQTSPLYSIVYHTAGPCCPVSYC